MIEGVREVEREYRNLGLIWKMHKLSAPRTWFRFSQLGTQRFLLDYRGHFSFLVDMKKETAEIFRAASSHDEQIQVYMQTQLRGLILAARGGEPLHGEVMDWNGKTFAILGDSGSGKSTLAASLISRGARLISDDLVIHRAREAQMFVLPANPLYLKLYPEAQKRLLPSLTSRQTMNRRTQKRIFRMPAVKGERKLSAVFVLENGKPSVHRMNLIEAHLSAVQNTFSTVWWPRARLTAQFEALRRLAESVRFFRLTHLRQWSALDKTAQNIHHVLAEQTARDQ